MKIAIIIALTIKNEISWLKNEFCKYLPKFEIFPKPVYKLHFENNTVGIVTGQKVMLGFGCRCWFNVVRF